MQPQEFYDLVHAPTFRPFRLHTTDGKSVVVRHDWQCMLFKWGFVVGEPHADLGPPVLADYERYRYADIARVENLAGQGAKETA